MTQERRKVLFYLRPDIGAGERYADMKINSHPLRDRSDMIRTAMLAGLALGEVDGRLPSMLASLLSEESGPDIIRKMLVSFLEIEQAPPVMDKPTQPVTLSSDKPDESSSVSASNLANSLPD